jgi:hypothetical protein
VFVELHAGGKKETIIQSCKKVNYSIFAGDKFHKKMFELQVQC